MRNRPDALNTSQRRAASDPDGSNIPSLPAEPQLQRLVALAFAPIHKAAFGVATGTIAAFVVSAATILDYIVDPQARAGLDLLAEYFYGYTVSPAGALVGLLWAFGVGFIAGWFVAFARNVVLAVWVLYFRAHADWDATNEFIDYL